MSLVLDKAAQDLLFREARTANAFTDEPVTDEQIQAVYDLVKYAPTSLNMQPLRVVLVRTPEARQRLVDTMGDGNKAKTLAAPLTAILAADHDFHEKLEKTFPHAPGAKDWFAEEEARIQTSRFNGALQVGYFILGVRAAGLAAGPMTGFDADRLNKEFFGNGKASVLAVVNIGKPADNAWFNRNPRLDFDEVVTSV
jgi:3-hydroxypropanoate dehydrogenase